MAYVSDVTTVPYSGLNSIDALLEVGPGWNWLTPARTVIYYTFSVASGNETGNTGISGVSAFNGAQQSACLSQLAYISNLTGITFAPVTDGTAADIHFAATDIVIDRYTCGLCSWNVTYYYDSITNVVTNFNPEVYVYLDNAEWAWENNNPIAGGEGYESLLHELGHALGLKHPFDGNTTLPVAEDNTSNSIMSYTEAGGPYSTFSPYDVAALMWLYGGDGIGGALGVSSPGVYLIGDSKSNLLHGGSGSDVLLGGNGSDVLEGLAGNDSINGGAGIDVAIFSGIAAGYRFTRNAGTITVQDIDLTNGNDGTDTLSGVETMRFSDMDTGLVSGLEYIASYSDLMAALGANEDAGVAHFLQNGVYEGRITSFDALKYTASYSDLINAFGADTAAAATHYILNGVHEGRVASFDALKYTASYGDLINAFGTDITAAETHYILNGAHEGRVASFDANFYLAKYGDLRTAFNADTNAATLHYIVRGFHEGRSADGSGNDQLNGSSSADNLNGYAGNDMLTGWAGNDTLTGGSGADTFAFSANQGRDTITDFRSIQGDHISIASGTNGITTTAQALAHVYADASGNAMVDLGSGNTVMLAGVTASSLHATDFLIV